MADAETMRAQVADLLRGIDRYNPEHLATLETLQLLLRLGLGIVLKHKQKFNKFAISTKPIYPLKGYNIVLKNISG